MASSSSFLMMDGCLTPPADVAAARREGEVTIAAAIRSTSRLDEALSRCSPASEAAAAAALLLVEEVMFSNAVGMMAAASE